MEQLSVVRASLSTPTSKLWKRFTEKKQPSPFTCNSTPAFLAAAVIFSTSFSPPGETLENVPQTLSNNDGRAARIQHPKSKKAEYCVGKCVTTCIRGGAGSPGEGPLNARSLIECSDICNLLKDGDDGP